MKTAIGLRSEAVQVDVANRVVALENTPIGKTLSVCLLGIGTHAGVTPDRFAVGESLKGTHHDGAVV
jgi:hypothetical protein